MRMRSLAELQQDFAAALLSADTDVAARVALLRHDIATGAFSVAERLQVYRHNVQANYLNALEQAFPATRRLVGAEFFAQQARTAQRRFPSTRGDLHHVGAGFVAALRADFAEDVQLHWLPDVADLEWAWQQAQVAPDPATQLDLIALQRVPPDDYARLSFTAHPAMRLLCSRWPMFTIWDANRGEADPEDTIDLDRGGECVVISRPHDLAQGRLCQAAEHRWLETLAGGGALGEAVDAALEIDPGFTPDRPLQLSVADGLWIGFAVLTPRRPAASASAAAR